MKEGHSRARLAFDIFIHRLRSCVGAMIAVLGGIDALIFTAGIGENSPEVRAAACASFEHLGLKLDTEKNQQSAPDSDVARTDSTVRVMILRAQEDWAITKDCWKLRTARTGSLASAI